ncbi:ORF6N domain-containing protein [Mycoplasmopsis californica]|uniref:ORF6N domain-containing protein n=1 Tax=Mycoplasmopsis californica TaxID=2113 RepID=UPI0018E096C9
MGNAGQWPCRVISRVETKYLNKQRNRNASRFPEDFCFQLTKEEYEFLRCQNGTSSSNNNYVVEDICPMSLQNKELPRFLLFLKMI